MKLECGFDPITYADSVLSLYSRFFVMAAGAPSVLVPATTAAPPVSRETGKHSF